MAVTVQEKAKVIADYQRCKGDTGFAEVQVSAAHRAHQRPQSTTSSQRETTTRGAACCGWCRVAAKLLDYLKVAQCGLVQHADREALGLRK
jgi:hypothetical protein